MIAQKRQQRDCDTGIIHQRVADHAPKWAAGGIDFGQGHMSPDPTHIRRPEYVLERARIHDAGQLAQVLRAGLAQKYSAPPRRRAHKADNGRQHDRQRSRRRCQSVKRGISAHAGNISCGAAAREVPRAIDLRGSADQFLRMSLSQTDPTQDELRLRLQGEWLTPLCEGGLWWERQRVLIVSDLHLEKGSSYAARGQMLPPYDTCATLACVEALCTQLKPDTIISLGDSFHDPRAELRLPCAYADRIRALTTSHDWVWVEGNHDPDPPAHLGGRAAKTLHIGPLVFRHEPSGETGEIAGHLHPAAKVRGRGRAVRRRCFATDGARLIMPAMGAFTGGLNVMDKAFESVFPDGCMAFALAAGCVRAVPASALVPDGPRAGVWRL